MYLQFLLNDDTFLQGALKRLDGQLDRFADLVLEIQHTMAMIAVKYPENSGVVDRKNQWVEALETFLKIERPQQPMDTPGTGYKTPSNNLVPLISEKMTQSQFSPGFLAAVEELERSGLLDQTPKEQTKVFQSEPLSVDPIAFSTEKIEKNEPRVSDVIEKTPAVTVAPGESKLAGNEPALMKAQHVDQVVGKEARPNREKKLPEALRSPYVRREVSLQGALEKAEDKVSAYMFSAWSSEW